jgi:hypothetical protein
LIDGFLNLQPTRDSKACPDCEGRGYRPETRDGLEGVVKCRHERLDTTAVV